MFAKVSLLLPPLKYGLREAAAVYYATIDQKSRPDNFVSLCKRSKPEAGISLICGMKHSVNSTIIARSLPSAFATHHTPEALLRSASVGAAAECSAHLKRWNAYLRSSFISFTPCVSMAAVRACSAIPSFSPVHRSVIS